MASKKPDSSQQNASSPALRTVSSIPKLPSRKTDAHKGDFGRVLIIGGSRGMIGAPALAANAALRSGAGLVTIACPEPTYPAVATLCPCATTIPLLETPTGQLDPVRALTAIDDSGLFGNPAKPTVIAAGPGLARGTPQFDQMWRELITEFAVNRNIPIVLDADGLNAMPTLDLENDDPTDSDWSNLVLTPHPGEMARLCNTTAADVQSRRKDIIHAAACRANQIASARLAERSGAEDNVAAASGCTILLKGAGTLVCDGSRIYTNKTGNPGMATGGSGDVLTGIIAALIGQGMRPFDAAVLGAHVHGIAGDLTARVTTQASMIATDLIAALPRAFA